MSWAAEDAKVDIREAALADDSIVVGGSECCLLRRQDRAGLIKGNIAIYNKMHERFVYPFEAEFIELKDMSITGDALSATHLNDAAALSYVIELVTERFQQYNLSNLFSKFPVLDMAIISTREWTSTFIDLLSRDQFNPILNQVIKSSPSIMSWAIKTFTIKIGEAAALADDVVIDVGGNECLLKRAAFQGDPITLVLIIKHLSGLRSRAAKQLYEHVAKININKEIVDIVGIFTISICEDFNAVFKAPLTQHELGDPAFTYQRVFNISNNLYYKHQDKWVSAENNQRGFLDSNSDIHCHNCGGEGHIQRDCAKPHKQAGGDLGPAWFKPLVPTLLGIRTATCAFAMIPCMTLELVYPYLSTCCSSNVVVLPLISNM